MFMQFSERWFPHNMVASAIAIVAVVLGKLAMH
jgi:hypothetical protein